MNWRSHLPSGRSRVRRAAIVVAAATALTPALLTLPTPAAEAASCPDNTLCTWQNSNYGGTQWNYSGHLGYWWYVGNSANDQISSLHWNYNSSLQGVFAYVAKNCPADSQWTWISPGGVAPNLANNKWPDGTSMNDSISAWAITTNPKATFPAHGSRTAGGC
jgi:hypothetical protein